MATPGELAAAPGSVGQPLPGTRVRLLDGAGRPVAAGAIGRISVSGPLVLRPAADGWLDSGDLGRLDPGGRLFVCGRADAMFVSGGENVYPEETEATLVSHPALLDAAVTVVPDAEFGQRMLAWVVPRAAVPLDEGVVRDWMRAPGTLQAATPDRAGAQHPPQRPGEDRSTRAGRAARLNTPPRRAVPPHRDWGGD